MKYDIRNVQQLPLIKCSTKTSIPFITSLTYVKDNIFIVSNMK